MSEKIPIFIINLKQDSHKRKHMEKLCKQHNLNCQFIEAVYGKDLDEETLAKVYNKKESIDLIGRELTKGELGCALSHLSIYKHMIDKNINQAIIFEDDIHIKKDFSTIIQNMNALPDNWELVLLGYFRGSVEKEKLIRSYLRYRKNITDTHKLVRLTQIASGSHGYLINLKGAKKLIETLKTIRLPIDEYTGNDKYINLYAIFPRLVRVHHVFAKELSTLQLERDRIVHKYNENLHNKNKQFIYKLKREIQRVFKQSVNLIKNLFKPVRKYTKTP